MCICPVCMLNVVLPPLALARSHCFVIRFLNFPTISFFVEKYTDFYHDKDSLANLTAKAKQSISHTRIASECNESITNRSTLSNPESSTVHPRHFSKSSPSPTLTQPQYCLSVLLKSLSLGGIFVGPVLVLPPLFGAAGAGAFGGGAKTGAGVTGAGGRPGAGVVLPFPSPPPLPPLSLFAHTRPSAYPDEIATARHSRLRPWLLLATILRIRGPGGSSRRLRW